MYLPQDIIKNSTAEFVPGFTIIDPQTGEKTAPTIGRASGPLRNEGISRVFSTDRLALRCVLLTGLTEHELSYGMSYQSMTILKDDGLVEAVFDNGERVGGGLLVDAEGVYSHVRQQYILQAATLLDIDGRAIYGKTKLTEELVASMPAIALKTTTLMTDENPLVSLFLEPMRVHKGNPVNLAPHLPSMDDYVYWVLLARTEHFHVNGYATDIELFTLSNDDTLCVAQALVTTGDSRLQSLFSQQHAPSSASRPCPQISSYSHPHS